MSHILRRDFHEVRTTRPYAAVRVEVVSLRPCVLQVTGDVFLLKRGIRLAKLPTDVQVLGDDTPVKASGEFYISTETFNPYHALTDVLDESLFY